ncbi:MAG: hypothetical protein D6732_18015 [Methanobacteriota archaeon]|nr:MAG: hypothetical protein D6732_18015 [Euryarchaeota archaeon]
MTSLINFIPSKYPSNSAYTASKIKKSSAHGSVAPFQGCELVVSRYRNHGSKIRHHLEIQPPLKEEILPDPCNIEK